MELAAPRSLIDANGQLTSFVQQQVPQRISYGTNHQAFYPGVPQAMNGPFKFFVQTPAHFLPDPNSPVATQGIYQSAGVQASLSPVAFNSMGSPAVYGSVSQASPVMYGSMPQASAAAPFGSYVMTEQGAQAVQLPSAPRGATVHSAFSDVSPAVHTPLDAAGMQGPGTPLMQPPGSGVIVGGSPVASGVAVPPPAGWVQGPVVSMPAGTPISAGVPAALLSGVSGASGTAGSPPMYPVAAGTPAAGTPNRFGMAGTPVAQVQAQAQRAGTEITLTDLDGTATTGTTMTTGSKSGKKKGKSKRSNRCMCF